MQQHGADFAIPYLNVDNDTVKTKEYIAEYFKSSFDLYYSLYDNIKEEHIWDCSCKLRVPMGWYLGHTASFYNNKLRMYNFIDRQNNSVYKYFDYMFAQGTDELDWNDFVSYCPSNHSHWPSVDTLKQYAIDTRDDILRLIENIPLTTLPISNSQSDSQQYFWWILLMGIEHERIHLETSGMLIRQLPIHKIKEEITGIWKFEYPLNKSMDTMTSMELLPVGLPQNELLPVAGRRVTYGRGTADDPVDMDTFGWDAEYGQFTVDVPDFNASKYLVSNYEYLEFVLDGGYLDNIYWSETAWQWVQDTNAVAPKFWVFDHDETGQNPFTSFNGMLFQGIQSNGFLSRLNLKLRNLLTEIDMKFAWSRPVICNHYEAQAFLKWKGEQSGKQLRLLTEDEWFVLRTLEKDSKVDTHTMTGLGDGGSGNINFQYFASEVPVCLFEFGNTGFYDVIGNVQQHTLTQFHPFDGYEVDPLYSDFTTPFLNESYFLMKGGSYLSSGNMALIHNRCEWFRPHYFQAAGIRYVESSRTMDDIEVQNEGRPTTESYFEGTEESNEAMNEMVHFQYSKNEVNVRQSVADIVTQFVRDLDGDGRYSLDILDIGCGAGGVSYGLAGYFGDKFGDEIKVNVVGVDDRARMIGLANQMQQNYRLEYTMDSIQNGEDQVVFLEDLGLENTTDSVRFIHDKELDFVWNNEMEWDVILGYNIWERFSTVLTEKDLSSALSDNGVMILIEDDSVATDEEGAGRGNVFGSGMKKIHDFELSPQIHPGRSLSGSVWSTFTVAAE